MSNRLAFLAALIAIAGAAIAAQLRQPNTLHVVKVKTVEIGK